MINRKGASGRFVQRWLVIQTLNYGSTMWSSHGGEGCNMAFEQTISFCDGFCFRFIIKDFNKKKGFLCFVEYWWIQHHKWLKYMKIEFYIACFLCTYNRSKETNKNKWIMDAWTMYVFVHSRIYNARGPLIVCEHVYTGV